MDLHTRFERLGGTIEPASPEVINADLTRGRRAVRRRRTARTLAASGLGVAAIAAAFALTTTTGGDRSGTPVVAQSTAAGLRLVDYRGAQPRYFKIDKVPEGFFVQRDDESGLTLAPADPAVANSAAPEPGMSVAPRDDPQVFTGKIGVFLEHKSDRAGAEPDASDKKVTVGGRQALLHHNGPVTDLLISVSPDVYAGLQFDVRLTEQQMLELGAGLHVDRNVIDRFAAARGN
jgi:hypothetical protein